MSSDSESDGGSAFPHAPEFELGKDGIKIKCVGISVLDYFAAAALKGWVGKQLVQEQIDIFVKEGGSFAGGIAKACYEQGEAMIKEREKRRGK